MKLLVYGGSFNPPHRGHVAALMRAVDQLRPDAAVVIPARTPPHKEIASGSPSPEERLYLAQLAFGQIPGVTVSDMELHREEPSYTVNTLAELAARDPRGELYFLMGTDMLLYMEKWYDFQRIFRLCTLAVLTRNVGEEEAVAACGEHLRKTYGAKILFLPGEPLPMDSTTLRGALCRREGADRLPEKVYERIIQKCLYGTRPDLAWLRRQSYALLKPSRVAHVAGCEAEAVKLARRWGADEQDAVEAAILHDVTKKLTDPEQLRLCEEYGIMTDAVEQREPKLLHARTGAFLARDRFGVSQPVFDAIQWHTTGRVGMTLLEKIIYMADYMEPTRNFDGVDKLRELAYTDLDRAMVLGLKMSLSELQDRGAEPHPRSVETLAWLQAQRKDFL